jgi:hypothetical protein
MTRLQFWILTVTSSVAGLLLLGQIAVSQMARSTNRELQGMEILIQQGEESNKLWQQIAVRTYQASQQDPTLKEVLSRQQITVSPKAAKPAPPTTPAPAN